MRSPLFIRGRQVELEESMTCEFKEVRGKNPVQAISKIADEYVVAYLNELGGSVFWGIRDDRRVTGVQLSEKMRDELRQVLGQKISSIAPSVPGDYLEYPLHTVASSLRDLVPIQNTFVVEIAVKKPPVEGLYLTGKGEAFKKTLGGTKRLTGSELLLALLSTLKGKLEQDDPSDELRQERLARFPSVARRAGVVKPLLKGGRILWVDDNPLNVLHERTALASLGIAIDIVTSTEEALHMSRSFGYDLLVTDIRRGSNPMAGVELLTQLRVEACDVPAIFYVAQVDPERPAPAGALAITNLPDQLLHSVFDVLERRRS